MDISIVIPVKFTGYPQREFVSHIVQLSKELINESCQIIIANESDPDIYLDMDSELKPLVNVNHFVPDERYRDGDNDKLNGVYAALKKCDFDKVLLIDDHFRVSLKCIQQLSKYYDVYDAFKTMSKFEEFPLSVKVDLCGMFIINLLDPKKQYCGHLAFRKSHFEKVGFPERDGLFDEFVMEDHLRKYDYNIGFISGIAIEATQKISMRKFLEQRVRYAYENLAIPTRFTLFLSVLPVLLILLAIDPKLMLFAIIMITVGVLAIGGVGQVIYIRGTGAPMHTFLYSVLWFWFYPITTWIAVIKYCTGGVYFGGRKVKRAR